MPDPIDFTDPDMDPKGNTMLFAKGLRKDDPKFTMGTMSFVLNLSKRPEGNTMKQSALLRHFRDFVDVYFFIACP